MYSEGTRSGGRGAAVAAVAKIYPAKYAGRGGVNRNDDCQADWRLAPGAPFLRAGGAPRCWPDAARTCIDATDDRSPCDLAVSTILIHTCTIRFLKNAVGSQISVIVSVEVGGAWKMGLGTAKATGRALAGGGLTPRNPRGDLAALFCAKRSNCSQRGRSARNR